MPAVVTFWQLPGDEKDFLRYLKKTGNVLGIPDLAQKSLEALTPQPLEDCFETPDDFYLGLDEFARSAPIKEFEYQGEEEGRKGERLFALDYMSPCLIHYTRPRIRNGKLGQSNLYAYWEHPAELDTCFVSWMPRLYLKKKDPNFVKWAKKVLNWVRRRTPEKIEYNGYPYRATKRAKEAMLAGKIEVES